MLSEKVKKRIEERKWDKHSNKSKFFSDIEKHVDSAINDMKIIADNFPPDKFHNLFTLTRFNTLLTSVLEPGRYKELLKKPKKKLNQTELNEIKTYEEILRTFYLLCIKLSLVKIEKFVDDPFALELFQQHNKPLYNTLDRYFDQQLSTIDNQGRYINQ